MLNQRRADVAMMKVGLIREDTVLRLCKSTEQVELEILIADEYICLVVDCGAWNEVEVRHKQKH